LARFDDKALAQHRITPADIEQVRQYATLLQGPDSPTLADIAAGCPYGTSALLHEVTELRLLLRRDPHLLARSRQQVSAFLHANKDAHVQALATEYRYLQDQIRRRLGAEIAIGALVKANTSQVDFDLLFESDLARPILFPARSEIEQARGLLERLKRVGQQEEC